MWESTFKSTLAEFGHRNWIVIADEAYPKQSAAGIQTIATGQDQIYVLKTVLDEIDNAVHVNPIILLDEELDYVSEEVVPGVEKYRSDLKNLLGGKRVNVMKHEEIISKLDEASELFNVLIIKTNMVIPYTSVFLQLDCGYWGPEQEKNMRQKIAENR